MTQEALKLALEALEVDAYVYNGEKSWKAITAIKEALAKEKTLQALHSENERLGLYKDAYAEPEQEPIKDWVASHNAICALLRQAHDALALTSYPMKRTWVGLTDGEIDYLLVSTAGENEETHISFARAIEAKLKERNT